ncbi:MAG: glycosyltransferase family 4 protein [candidate division WOR-3 bacterium]
MFSDSVPTVLFVGRLDHRKGLLLLITSMAEVITVIPETRLLVVGTGPEERAARMLCRRLGIGAHVRFCGHVSEENIPAYYTSATVYCSPALGGEAMGIVLLEAMASGRAVVAADIPGYDEVIRNNIDGLLVPPRNVSALTAALVRTLTDSALRKRLAEEALRRAAEFAWPSVASQIAEVYEEVTKH